MTVGDILVSINQASLETMLPLTAVQEAAEAHPYGVCSVRKGTSLSR